MNKKNRKQEAPDPKISALKTHGPLAARLIVGAIFAVSGYAKLVHPVENFAAAIESYYILDASYVFFVALWLPWLEIIVGAYLLTGLFTKLSGSGAALFSTAFLGLHLRSMAKGIYTEDCGCFGSFGPHLNSWQMAVFNGILLALSVWVVYFPPGRWSLDDWTAKPLPRPLDHSTTPPLAP
ncbi:MAG: hypothetical protein A3G41_08770 [Elusimicrobia bacterium RIFCSPLOWO2_12_FULL_59_9]|nr:MAG: hypothetical protein A3G41_08770 [Elusimicrobia bacterium RIFCSPLOWO2_12_FULL_59_9]